MTDMEIAHMVAVLVLMSAEHFRKCADYVSKTDMQMKERSFMNMVISVAESKRKERKFT